MPKKATKMILITILIVIIIIAIIKFFNLPEKIIKVIYPKGYSECVEKYAEEYGVDPYIIYAVIKSESNFKKDVVSKSNAKGIMQLMDSTAEEVYKEIGIEEYNENMLFDPEKNIKIGTKYLSDLITKYNGNYYLVAAAYNAGIGTVDRWIKEGVIKSDGSDIENIPYKETNMYVRKIVSAYNIYQKVY